MALILRYNIKQSIAHNKTLEKINETNDCLPARNGFSYGDYHKNTQPYDLLNNSALTLFRVLLVVLVDGEKMLFIVILFLHLVFALHFSMNLNALYNVMLCSALKCMMKWRAKTKWIKLYISDLIFEPKRQSNNSVCVPNNFWDHVSKHCIEKF